MPRDSRIDDEEFSLMDSDFQHWLTGAGETTKKKGKKSSSSAHVEEVGGFLGIMDAEDKTTGKPKKAVWV